MWRRILKRVVGGVALLLSCITLLGLWAISTPSGTSWLMNRARSMLTAGTLETLSWRSIEGTLLDGISLSGLDLVMANEGGRLQLRISEVGFGWRPWELRQQQLHLTFLRINALDLDYSSGTPAAPGEPLTRETLQGMLFSLPIVITLDDLQADNLDITIDGAPIIIEEIDGSLAYDNEALRVPGLLVRAGGDIPGAVNGSITLDNVLGLDADLDWQLTLAEQSWQGHLVAGGDLESLALEHDLQAPLALQSVGTVEPGIFEGSTLQLDLQHELAFVDLGVFGQPGIQLSEAALRTAGNLQRLAVTGGLAFSADAYDFSGRTDLALAYVDGRVEVTSLALESEEAGLQLQGVVGTAPLEMQLDWNLLHLDLSERVPQLRAGELTGAGSVELNIDDAGLDAQIGISALNGSLDNRPLAVTGSVLVVDGVLDSLDLQAESDSNRILASGAIQPAMDLAWEIRLPALGQLWAGMRGEIDGSGTLRGSAENPEINGNLLGTGFSIPLDGQTLALDRLALDAAYAQGSNDLVFALGSLTLTDASGTTSALLSRGEITLQGTPQDHRASLQLVTAQDNVQLSLQGGLEGVDWTGELAEGHADSRFGIWDLQEPVRIFRSSTGAGLAEHCWQLQSESLQLCLQASQQAESGADARLQVTGLPLRWLNTQADENGDIFSSADVPQGIEDLLQQYAAKLPPALQVEGALVLEAAVEDFAAGNWARVNINVLPADIVIEVRQDEQSDIQTLIPQRQRFAFHDSSASVTNTNGVWQGEAGFQVSRDTELGQDLQGGFSASGSLRADNSLDAILDFDFNDLAWLETLVPGLRNPRGSLFGTVMASGSLETPLFNIMLALTDGSFNLPEYGLALRDVGVELKSPGNLVNNNTLVLTATASSGDGQLRMDAELDDYLQSDRRINACISGSNFAAFNADYARVVLTPDIRFSLAPQGIDVSGELLLDDSFIDLAEMFGDVGNNAVGVSRDVVVVDASGAAEGRGNTVPLTMDLALNVGESVKLGGFGLDVSLNGMLALEQEAGRSLLAYGELAIPQGSYEIYNQQLNARDGRLLFFGNPANPVIDIRAFRETRNGEVGMLLSGPVSNIQGELYSSPALPESEILALLVTGKSFNNVDSQDGDALLNAIANFGIEKGQGLTGMVSNQLGLDSVSVNSGASYRDSSLGIGKYITPRLLLQYEVGLFDRQNVLSIDYSLTDNLKLEVRTGISQSVDLSYTIEKD
jgi:translocation and assembly module TamB